MPDPTIIAFPQDGRPVPPVYLSAAEAETWRAVVGARKAGYFGPEVFPATRSLLRDCAGLRSHRGKTTG